MNMRHNFVTLVLWIKAYLNFTSVHCPQKKQRAALLGKDRSTVDKNCKKEGVGWTEPPNPKGEVIPAPHWIPEMVHWMLNLRREDLPLKEVPAWMRRLFQGSELGDSLSLRLPPSNTVTVNLDHMTREGGRFSH